MIPKKWLPDADTYLKLQQFIPFVELVANHPLATKEQHQIGQRIIAQLKVANQPEFYAIEWFVGLDIFDFSLYSNERTREGKYWRKWVVTFEQNHFEFEMETNYTDDCTEEPDPYAGGGILYGEAIKKGNDYLGDDVALFIEDAKRYKSYLTKDFNEIEIDVDIWAPVKPK